MPREASMIVRHTVYEGLVADTGALWFKGDTG